MVIGGKSWARGVFNLDCVVSVILGMIEMDSTLNDERHNKAGIVVLPALMVLTAIAVI